jgi:hypothetical protein
MRVREYSDRRRTRGIMIRGKHISGHESSVVHCGISWGQQLEGDGREQNLSPRS